MPLIWVSLCFLAGIVSASLVSFSTWIWAAAFIAILLASLLARRFARTSKFIKPFAFVLLMAFSFGGWRYQIQQPKIDAFHIAFYNDRNYELLVSGSVDEAPDMRDTYTNLRIKVEAVDTGDGDLPVTGFILARIPNTARYEYGQRVRLRGLLKTPPEDEDFSYRDYLARQGIHSYMSSAEVTVLPGNSGSLYWRAVYLLKERLLENTHRLFNDPEASLLAGILLGVDTGLTQELQQAFKNTGTAHIIAISGFNIAIIAGAFLAIFRNLLGERYGSAAAILGIFFYTLLVGADAAVVRAAIMGSMSMLARLIGRKQHTLNGLMIAAMGMCIANPFFIWDVGFQLSFFATLGLTLYTEPFSAVTANLIQKFLHASGALVRIVNENIVLTFAAQLTTLPIMAYHFNRISLLSFLANPFILPVQPAVMILSGLALFTSLVIYPFGQLLAWAAWPFATYTIGMVELFDRIPHGIIFLGDFSIWFMVLFYAALLGVTFSWSYLKERAFAMGNRLRTLALTSILAVLFICTMLLWRSTATAGDGQMHVTFLEVGSAEAVLIQTPQGRNILINGGPSTNELSDELGRRLPLFTRRLDWLIVASTGEQEVAALPRVMERYPPDQVLWSGNVQASFSARALDEFFAAEGIPVSRAETGQRLELGEGAFIEVRAEGPRGSVLLIEYGNFRALFPLGVGEGTYESIEYGNTIGSVDVLLLADSGYAPSNPPDLVENLNPQLIVISVSAGDPHGLPAQEVLESLEGYSLLRTDRSGWISVSTDGREMRVEVERGSK
jgi:competence protein ComEC